MKTPEQGREPTITVIKQQSGHKNLYRTATTILLATIVIAIIAYIALTWHGIPTLSSNQTISLAVGKSSYFRLNGESPYFSIFLKNSTKSYATIYVSEVPVLTSPVSEFIAYNGEQINFSTSLSSTADLGIILLSATNSTSKIELIPIPSLYKIKASPSIVISNPASFYSNITGTATLPTPPSTTTTSVSSQPSSSKPSSSSTSATASSGNGQQSKPAPAALSPIQNISTILNYTSIGSLMKNYTILYAGSSSCTAPEYNTSLVEYVHLSPTGPLDFKNASQVTPTGLVLNASMISKTNYFVTYSPIVAMKTLQVVAVSFNLDPSTAAVTNLKFSGIFAGQNSTSLQKTYNFQNALTGYCKAYMP